MAVLYVISLFYLFVVACFFFDSFGYFIAAGLSSILSHVNPTYFLEVKNIPGIGNTILFALGLSLLFIWLMMIPILLNSAKVKKQITYKNTAKQEVAAAKKKNQ
ncbi:hypothetical protein ACFPU1_03340 [Thalassorhabdus alkalitolerans]|uniref:Uncharacterized protein n=1 Tax=Thalassorhabdus alkalitolerans TaxID=2282697 RepID=A0ABW0YJD8_9BACI